jgi:manganese transport protein
MTQPTAGTEVIDYGRQPATRETVDLVPFDPYALPPEAIADPPRRLGRILQQVGPGLILAGAIVGTGELIATTHVGAKVGFVLLWLVILSCFVKVFVQIELGRYAIASGHPSMTAFRQLGGVGTFIGACWCVMMLMTQLQLGAMVGGVGQALHMMMPGVSNSLAGLTQPFLGDYLVVRPEMPWALLTAVVTSAVLALGSYAAVEKGSTILVVMFTFMTIVCVFLLPAVGHPIAWSDVRSGLTFSLPAGSIAAAVAMFGITGVGAAELVAYPYWCIEKGYARKAGAADGSGAWLERARGWIRVMQVDAWVCMVVYTAATLAFYFLGAAVLFGRGAGGLPGNVSAMLNELSQMYAPVLGPKAAVVFIVGGVFAVLYSTLYASTAANSRALTDFLRVSRLITLREPGDRMRWVRRFCVAFPLIDLLLFAFVKNPVLMVTIGGFVQALMLPMIGGAALFLRYRRTDRRLTPGLAWDIFLWMSVAALTATAFIGARDQVMKLRG